VIPLPLLDEILQVAKNGIDQFAHDLVAWEQVEKSDVVFFVIDSTLRPGGRFNDDLNLLSKCGRPAIVLLNFVPADASHASLSEWKKHLAGFGFFQVTEFDAHRREFDKQTDLLGRTRSVLEKPLHKKAIDACIDELKEREQQRLRSAVELIADLILDVGLYAERKDQVRPEDIDRYEVELTELWSVGVRQREQEAWKGLLGLWDFTPSILDLTIPLHAEQEFQPDEHLLGDAFSIHTSGGAASGAVAGASVGVGIDLAFGGMTLGVASALGAAIGALLGLASGAGYNVAADQKRKCFTISGKPDLVIHILSRAIDLLSNIRHRGKAVPDKIRVAVSNVVNPAISVLQPSLSKVFSHCPGWTDRMALCFGDQINDQPVPQVNCPIGSQRVVLQAGCPVCLAVFVDERLAVTGRMRVRRSSRGRAVAVV